MKRIYIAVIFLGFSLIVGIIEYITINSYIDNSLNDISQVGDYVQNKQIKKAESLSKETADKFKKLSTEKLYCFYRHDELEEIIEALYSLEDLLDDKRIEDYHEKSHLLNEKLLFVKEKEQISIQNIL